MWCPNRTHDFSYQVPFLEIKDDKFKIFYTPWFSQEKQNDEVEDSAKTFAKKLNLYPKEQVKEVFLKKKRFFAIDNKRMLHGRKKIAPDTSRWFKRRWIAKGEFDERLIQ